VSVCVTNTYFQYEQQYYRQTRGMAMGSPLSSVLCNAYLEDLESTAIESFHIKPYVFLRYVDDIYIEWPSSECPIEQFLDHFNTQSEFTKFTMEEEKDGSLAFLDVLVKKREGEATTEVYRKPTDSGLFLQYDSNHPIAVKHGIVSTMMHRAQTHCSNEAVYKKEVKNVESILVNNKYPARVIRRIRSSREGIKKKKKEDKKPDATIVLPYVPRLSEKIRRIAGRKNIRTVFTSRDTIKSRLVRFKPKMKPINKDVIYAIPCECGKLYIGETGRTLEVRLQEHQKSIEKRDPDVSKLCEHYYKTGHRFLWDEAKVIGHEEKKTARKVHEAAEIYVGGQEIISSASFDIDPVWKPMLKNLKLPSHKKNNANNSGTRRSRRIMERNKRVDGESLVLGPPPSGQLNLRRSSRVKTRRR
jgi:hypothetical protein